MWRFIAKYVILIVALLTCAVGVQCYKENNEKNGNNLLFIATGAIFLYLELVISKWNEYGIAQILLLIFGIYECFLVGSHDERKEYTRLQNCIGSILLFATVFAYIIGFFCKIF